MSSSPDIEVPGRNDRIGRWTLVRPLGEGAFGTTWRVVDDDGHPAALKLLTRPPGDELRALSSVCHPAVVNVLDAGGGPTPFLAMELASGITVRALIRDGVPPLDRTLAVTAVLADALAAVHDRGVVHGDVKPDNIVVGNLDRTEAWLVDFGLAGTVEGGTLQYAAPEIIRGEARSAASDVYALGLVLYELVTGLPPWSEEDAGEALLRRCREAPGLPGQAPWLAELVVRLLAPEPGHRPAAAELADTLVSHGVRLPEPDTDLLLRRARTVHVRRPAVETTINAWLESGGTLAITGPSGSGRTHMLERIHTELRARGRPVLRLAPGARPWSGVEQLLADPDLDSAPVPLPTHEDPDARARAAAAAIRGRASGDVVLLVDDVAHLDDGSQRTLDAVVRDGWASICVAGETAPAWARLHCELDPFGHRQLSDLARGVLGASSSLSGLVGHLVQVSAGRPAPAVSYIVAAAQQGVLAYRRRWHVDDARLNDIPAHLELPVQLGEQAARVGAFIAYYGLPLAARDAADLADLTPDQATRAFRALESAGLISLHKGHARCRSLGARDSLRRLAEDPPAVHRTLLAFLQSRPAVALDRLGEHAAGTGDAKLAAALGPAAVADLMTRDVTDAARLADTLWALAPVAELEGPRMRALLAAGRTDDARKFGDGLLSSRSPSPRDLPVVAAMVRLYAGYYGDDDQAMVFVERAQRCVGEGPMPLELIEAEAQAHFRADRIFQAIATARRAPARPEFTHRSDIDRWLSIRGVLAQSLLRKGDLQAALDLIDRIPGELGAGRVARATLEAVRGRLLWHGRRLHEARAAMERAARKDAGLPALDRARLLNNAGLAAYQTGDRIGALTLWEKALFLFERLEVPLEQVRVQINLCVVYREAGRWERARLAGQWALSRAAELSMPEYEAMAAGNLGDLYLAQEAWEEADRWYARAGALADKHELTGETIELARRRAELAVAQRDPDAMRLALFAEEAAGGMAETLFERCRASALVAVCLARAGRFHALDSQVDKAIDPLREAGAAADLAEVRLWVAEAYVSAGRVEDALAMVPRVKLYAEEVGNLQLRLRAERLAARARVDAAESPWIPLERLVSLSERLAREGALPSALDLIASAALDVCNTDRAFVAVLDNGIVTIAAARARSGPVGEPTMDIIHRCVHGARKVVAADLSERRELLTTTNAANARLRSVVCVPLIHHGTVLGALSIDSTTVSEHELVELDLFVRALAVEAASTIARHRHMEQITTEERRARELIHDMRNVMAPMTYMGSAVLDVPNLDADVRQDLQHIINGAEQMVRLANRFVRGQARGVHTRFDLCVLLEQIVAIHRYHERSRLVAVVLDVGEPAPVLGDRGALARALGNVLSNAVRHSPDGSEVSVGVRIAKGTVTVSVRDNGAGIPADQLRSVFEHGVRADESPGAGLGLAIAHRILAEHDAVLWAENAPGGGAVFHARLPLSR